MKSVLRLALACALPAVLAGCNKNEPRVPVPVALLETPAPPARLLIPVELPEYVAPEPEVVEAPAPPPTPPRPAPTTAARPTDKPTTPAPDAAPPPVLRTTPDSSAAERTVQASLSAAQQSLGRVNYRDLTPYARQQYDLAKDYIRMATDALKIRNYFYAETLARKAVSVAALLVRG